MRRTIDKHNNFGTIWSCRTADFTIRLVLAEPFEAYDGDDEDNAIQEALNSGDLVMFDSRVEVYADHHEDLCLGAAYLGASVYKDGETWTFIKGWYFLDMLNEACTEARETINNMPKLRAVK